ncbi:MAG: amidohydrolase [Bacillota bacterium]
MMTKEELKQRVCAAIDRRAEELTEVGETIMRMPELGYKEWRTAALVEEKFKSLGLSYRKEVALTGLVANLPAKSAGPRVAVLGELDAVLCPGHPFADPETGAAHSCGHNAQITSMLGVAMGLIDAGAMEHLAGEVALMAVPAEEPVEIEFRQHLRKQGKIQFLGGKQEFIALGEFDHIDAAVMMHLTVPKDGKRASVGGSSNGFVAKFIKYKGKEAHAGGAPHLGVNALNGAMLGLMGIHAQRETFKDDDHIRIHPIVTHGGDLVNVIPADVRIETYVRGAKMDGIVDASAKTNRALRAGADAVGAEVVIEEIPGFLPRVNEPEALCQLFRDNLAALIGADAIATGTHGAGSTDMADVEHVVPGIHPYIGGALGRGHSEDYQIGDPELAYITSSKALAMTVVDLLWDGGKLAKEIKADFVPKYTKDTYLAMWRELTEGKAGADHE